MSSIFGAAIGGAGVYLAHTALIAGGAALPATLPVVAMALGAAALIGLFTGRNAGKDGSTMPQATLLAMLGGFGAQWWANGQPASRVLTVLGCSFTAAQVVTGGWAVFGLASACQFGWSVSRMFR